MAAAHDDVDTDQFEFENDADQHGDFNHDGQDEDDSTNQIVSSFAHARQHSPLYQPGSDSKSHDQKLPEPNQVSVPFNHHFSSSDHIRFNETSSPTLEVHAVANHIGRRRRLLSSSVRLASSVPTDSNIELAIGIAHSSTLISTSALRAPAMSSGERQTDWVQMQQQHRQRVAEAHQQRMVAAQLAAGTSADVESSLWLDGRATGLGTNLLPPSDPTQSSAETANADSARRLASRFHDDAVSETAIHRPPQQLRKPRGSSAMRVRHSADAVDGGEPHRVDTASLGEIFTAAASRATGTGAGTSGGHGGRMTALGVLTQSIKASAATQRLRETGGGLEAPFLRVNVASSHDTGSSDSGGSGRTLSRVNTHHGSSAVHRSGGTSGRGQLTRGLVSAPAAAAAAAAAVSADSQFSAIAAAMLAIDSTASRVSTTDQQPQNKEAFRRGVGGNAHATGSGNATAGRLRRGLAFGS